MSGKDLFVRTILAFAAEGLNKCDLVSQQIVYSKGYRGPSSMVDGLVPRHWIQEQAQARLRFIRVSRGGYMNVADSTGGRGVLR